MVITPINASLQETLAIYSQCCFSSINSIQQSVWMGKQSKEQIITYQRIKPNESMWPLHADSCLLYICVCAKLFMFNLVSFPVTAFLPPSLVSLKPLAQSSLSCFRTHTCLHTHSRKSASENTIDLLTGSTIQDCLDFRMSSSPQSAKFLLNLKQKLKLKTYSRDGLISRLDKREKQLERHRSKTFEIF